MKRHYILLMAIDLVVTTTLSVILTSCNKDEENNSKEKVKLLETYVFDGAYVKYEYDNLNRITQCLHYSKDGVHKYIERFAYEGNNIKKFEYGWPESEYYGEAYSKVGNRITITIPYYDVFSSIDLNNDDFPVISEGYSFEGSGDYVRMYSLTFEYQNENLIKLTISDEVEEYVYANDDKKSPFYCCKTPKWFMFYHFTNLASKNNIVKDRKKNHTYSEYTYDNDGYPIKCIVTGKDENKFLVEYKYKTIN